MDNTRPEVQVTLEPYKDVLDPSHAASRQARTELQELLRSPELGTSASREPVEGTKGSGSDVLVGLGGPAGIGALVRALRLWLGRDRKRSLQVTIRNGATESQLLLTGDSISTATLERALEAATRTVDSDGPDRRGDPGQSQ